MDRLRLDTIAAGGGTEQQTSDDGPHDLECLSIAVISFNQRHLLERCLDSIFIQDYPCIDLIVIDDASCDFLEEDVRKYIEQNKSGNIVSCEVKRFNQNVGIAAAHKEALDKAKGNYIMFFGGDDQLTAKDILSRIMQRLRERPAAVLQTQAILLNDQSEASVILPTKDEVSCLRKKDLYGLAVDLAMGKDNHILCLQAAAFEVDTLRKIKAFTSAFSFAIDWPLYLSLLTAGYPIRFVAITSLRLEGDGAYRKDEVGNLYIRKGYWRDAARAIREIAFSSSLASNEDERLKLNRAANALDAHATQYYEWPFFPVLDRDRWRKDHQDFFELNRKYRSEKFRYRRFVLLVFFLFYLGLLFYSAVYVRYPSTAAAGVFRTLFFTTCILLVLILILVAGTALKKIHRALMRNKSKRY